MMPIPQIKFSVCQKPAKMPQKVNIKYYPLLLMAKITLSPTKSLDNLNTEFAE